MRPESASNRLEPLRGKSGHCFEGKPLAELAPPTLDLEVKFFEPLQLLSSSRLQV